MTTRSIRAIALEAAKIPATFEYPEITFTPHYASEANERKPHLGLPTQIRVEAFLHNGNYSKLIHCTVHNTYPECWNALYQSNIKVGAVARKQIEARYMLAFNLVAKEYDEANYVDPAAQI